MHLSLSKMMRMCGCRIGIGARITKKNAAYMLPGLLIGLMFQFTWCIMIAVLWVVGVIAYGFFYALFWCAKKIFKGLWRILKSIAGKITAKLQNKKGGE